MNSWPKDLSIENLEAPLFFAWQMTNECNLSCLHCCEESGPGKEFPDRLTDGEIDRLIHEIVELQIPYAAFGGGEPLLHPRFFDTAEFFRKHGLDIKIETNGHGIDREKAGWFAATGFRSVQVSLDGATKESYEKMRVGGSWEEALSACRHLVKAGVNTEILFVPCRFNIEEVGPAVDTAYSLGCSAFYTSRLMRFGRAAVQNWDTLPPTEEEYQKFLKTLEKKEKEYAGRMRILCYPYDALEELKFYLKTPTATMLMTPSGGVKLIGSLPFLCGSYREQNLREIWENYKKGWKDKRVIDYVNRISQDPALFREANHPVELY